MSNSDYPTTRGMTDAEVHARQLKSRRVTAKATRPVNEWTPCWHGVALRKVQQ